MSWLGNPRYVHRRFGRQLNEYLQISHSSGVPCLNQNVDPAARSTFELLDAKLVERARDHIEIATEKARDYNGDRNGPMLCIVSGCMRRGGLMNLRKHIRQEYVIRLFFL